MYPLPSVGPVPKNSMWSAEKSYTVRRKLILIAVFPPFLGLALSLPNVLLMLLLFLTYMKSFTHDGWPGLSDVWLQKLSYM